MIERENIMKIHSPISSANSKIFTNTKHLFLIMMLILTTISMDAAEDFPSSAPEGQGISTKALEKLKEIVTGYLDEDEIVGAELLVIKNRHTVLHETFGWKDREDGIEMEKNTLFNIRSMTKPLTGAAIQILIDEGKLKLTDPAAKYIPGFRNGKSEAITIEQLLTHRSGLPLTILTSMLHMMKYGNLPGIADAAGENGPQFEPDEKFWYSDAGTEVLGAVVETISGMTVDQFVARRLLTPLGMTNSRYIFGSEPVNDPTIASNYNRVNGKWKKYWKNTGRPLYPYALGSQSVYSTPQDYARFLAMLMDKGKVGEKQILSPEAVARILSPVSPMSTLGSDMSMPTGFPHHKVYYGRMAVLHLDEKSATPDKPAVFGHTGSDGTYAWAWPDHDLMVLFFTQSRGSGVGIRLERDLFYSLISTEPVPPEDDVPEELKSFLGEYTSKNASPDTKPYKVLYQNGNLALDAPGRMVFDLNGPDDEGKWSFKLSAAVSVTFNHDASGSVDGLNIAQLIEVVQAKKTVEEEIPEETPEEYKPWLGTYNLQGMKLTVLYQDGNLAVNDPSEGVIKFKGPDDEGLWIDQYDKNQITFKKDAKGRTVLRIIANTRLIKK